jgi:hypothetical protein
LKVGAGKENGAVSTPAFLLPDSSHERALPGQAYEVGTADFISEEDFEPVFPNWQPEGAMAMSLYAVKQRVLADAECRKRKGVHFSCAPYATVCSW